MAQWQLREKPNLARAQAERETLAYMAKMPAWRPKTNARRRPGTWPDRACGGHRRRI
jgi:hypothetical protein